MPAPSGWSSTGAIASRQPCCASPPVPGARGPWRTRPPPASSAPASHAAGGAPRAVELADQRGVAEPLEDDEEPARGVRGAVVQERAVAHRPAHLGEARLRHRPVLVQDLAGLRVDLGIVAGGLQRRERAQRGARDLRRRGEHLQRGDQRVAAEEGVEAAGIARLLRRERGVRPALRPRAAARAPSCEPHQRRLPRPERAARRRPPRRRARGPSPTAIAPSIPAISIGRAGEVEPDGEASPRRKAQPPAGAASSA